MFHRISSAIYSTILVSALLWGALWTVGADEECDPSDLGYACMKEMASNHKVHWTVGGDSGVTELLDGEVPFPKDGEVAFAIEGSTTGYVGFGFTEREGRMSPADVVVGWTDGEATVVNPYRAVTTDLTDNELDESVTLGNVFASEKDGTTIVAYTWSLTDGNVDISLDAVTEVIWAVGPGDRLAYHSLNRGGGTIILGRALGETSQPPVTEPEEEPKENIEPVSQETVPSDEPEVTQETSELPSGCEESTLPGYVCQHIMPDGLVTLHWVFGPVEQEDDDLPDPKEGEISIAMVGETDGWVGFAFTEESGKMSPSDTIVGWITSDGELDVKPYRVTSRNISPNDFDDSITLTGIRGSEKDGFTTIEFTREKPAFLTSFEGTLSINAAVAGADSLQAHTGAQRWSSELDFLSGSSRDVTKDLVKYYNWHGAIMLVSWMFLAQLGVLIGSHKWVVPFGGEGGWFHVHRAIQTLVLLGTLAGFVIALVKFDEHEMTIAKVHRVFGYIAFSLGWLQGIAGFLRPGKDHPNRYLFNMFHRWGGFFLSYLGPATVLMGIYTYEEVEGIDVGKWLVPAVVSLACIVGLGFLLRVACKSPSPKPAKKQQQVEQNVGMTEVRREA